MVLCHTWLWQTWIEQIACRELHRVRTCVYGCVLVCVLDGMLLCALRTLGAHGGQRIGLAELSTHEWA